jgi:hypothetical protein
LQADIKVTDTLVRLYLALHQVEQHAAEPADELRLMRHRDDAEPARLAQSRDGLHHEGGVGRIERGRRLVQQERPRITEQGTRDCHPLLLAAGQRGGVAVEQLALEPHVGQGLAQAGFGQIAVHVSGPEAEVVAHCTLEDHRRLHDKRRAPPEPAGIEVPDVAALESNRSGSRLLETVQTSQQARLPRPRRAHERERPTTLYGEGDVLQDRGHRLPATSRVGEREMLDLEEGIVHVVTRLRSVIR